MNKEEAIVFTRKYLEDRRAQWIKYIDAQFDDIPKWIIEHTNSRVWEVCVDYILNDIIPYIYGEALD